MSEFLHKLRGSNAITQGDKIIRHGSGFRRHLMQPVSLISPTDLDAMSETERENALMGIINNVLHTPDSSTETAQVLSYILSEADLEEAYERGIDISKFISDNTFS
jgi:hypothetical protein